MRAIAALSVLGVHAAVLSGAVGEAWYRRPLGYLGLGVTLFFAISGFLLYRPHVAARVLGTPRQRLRDYARNRLLRIAPAYWFALTALGLLAGLQGVFSENWWVYYLLLQIYPVFDPDPGCLADFPRCGLVPAWSLAIEVAFYAMLPLLAFAAGRLCGAGRGWLARELALLAALCGISVWVQLGPATELFDVLRFSPVGLFFWFAVGMALAVASVALEQRRADPAPVRALAERSGIAWVAAAAIFLIGVEIVFSPVSTAGANAASTADSLGRYFFSGTVALLAVLPAALGARARGLPVRILELPAIAWLGLVSYGIFLWHYPLLLELVDADVLDWIPGLGFATLLVAGTIAAVACAAFSYYVVERPALRRKAGSKPAREPETDGEGDVDRRQGADHA